MTRFILGNVLGIAGNMLMPDGPWLRTLASGLCLVFAGYFVLTSFKD